MSLLPKKPHYGDDAITSLVQSVNQIIDYLPSLQVRGDNRTIRVNSFGYGKTIEVITQPQAIQTAAPASTATTTLSMVEIVDSEIPIKVKKVNADGSLSSDEFVLHTGTIAVRPGGVGGRIAVSEIDLQIIGGSQNL